MLKSCLPSIWFGFALVVLAVLNLFVFDLPGAPKPVGAFADVGEGARMHYVEHAGKGPAIVFLHGLPGTQADRVHALLGQRGVRGATVVGHS